MGEVCNKNIAKHLKVSTLKTMGRDFEAEEAQLHQHIQSIYGLVESPDGWQQTIESLHALMHQEQGSESLEALLPHIEQANKLIVKMTQLQLSHSQNEQVMERLPVAVMVITHAGRIVSSNIRAQELRDHPDHFVDHEYLCLQDAEHQNRVSKAIQHISKGISQHESLRLGNLNMWLFHHSIDQLAIFMADHTSYHDLSHATLIDIYALTRKEAAVAAELCNGGTNLGNVANQLGISISTARSHLKKIFSKTGASNQAELMKMILFNPAITASRQTKYDGHHIANIRRCLTLRLINGRMISWAEYGDPNGSPFLFCHPVTGCRLMIPNDIHMLKRKKIRLIIPDRAGYGYSTAANGDVMKQWLADMQCFLDALEIDRFGVMGYSVGGAYAMSLAVAFSARVTALHLISSIAPVYDKSDMNNLLPLSRMILYLVKVNVSIARAFINVSVHSLAKKPDAFFDSSLKDLPRPDRLMLERGELKQQLIACFSEATRQGVDHLSEEILYVFNGWKIDPQQLTCPVTIWHGLADKHAPYALMQRFAEKLPDCKAVHRVPEQGHYIFFSQWSDIVKELNCS